MQHALCITDKHTLLKFMIIELLLIYYFLSKLYHGWWLEVVHI